MPKFRVLKKSFLNKGLREEGEIVDLDIKYNRKAHPNLEPLDAGEKPKRKPKTTGKPGEVAEGDEELVDTNKGDEGQGDLA